MGGNEPVSCGNRRNDNGTLPRSHADWAVTLGALGRRWMGRDETCACGQDKHSTNGKLLRYRSHSPISVLFFSDASPRIRMDGTVQCLARVSQLSLRTC